MNADQLDRRLTIALGYTFRQGSYTDSAGIEHTEIKLYNPKGFCVTRKYPIEHPTTADEAFYQSKLPKWRTDANASLAEIAERKWVVQEMVYDDEDDEWVVWIEADDPSAYTGRSKTSWQEALALALYAALSVTTDASR